MAHGVTRPSGRGVPMCVFQKEVTGAKNIEKVRHTVKVAVVKGDSVCTNPLVCISLYDSKPVYLLSTACSEIKWIGKKRKVWHAGKNSYVNIKFLRLNVIDFTIKIWGVWTWPISSGITTDPIHIGIGIGNGGGRCGGGVFRSC